MPAAKASRSSADADERPGHDDALVAGPFHVGERDPPEQAPGDGAGDFGGTQRLGVAAALQFKLARTHGARHVDGEEQLHVDLGGGGRRGEKEGGGRESSASSADDALEAIGLSSGFYSAAWSISPAFAPSTSRSRLLSAS